MSGDVIMGIRHKKHNVVGVQFHPESILTEYGRKTLKNFFAYKKDEPQKFKIIKKNS